MISNYDSHRTVVDSSTTKTDLEVFSLTSKIISDFANSVTERDKHIHKLLELENKYCQKLHKKELQVVELKNTLQQYKAKYEKYKNLASVS